MVKHVFISCLNQYGFFLVFTRVTKEEVDIFLYILAGFNLYKFELIFGMLDRIYKYFDYHICCLQKTLLKVCIIITRALCRILRMLLRLT